MAKYIVRLWVDIEVEAESSEAAKKIVDRLPVEVGDATIYDIQTATVYDKE